MSVDRSLLKRIEAIEVADAQSSVTSPKVQKHLERLRAGKQRLLQLERMEKQGYLVGGGRAMNGMGMTVTQRAALEQQGYMVGGGQLLGQHEMEQFGTLLLYGSIGLAALYALGIARF